MPVPQSASVAQEASRQKPVVGVGAGAGATSLPVVGTVGSETGHTVPGAHVGAGAGSVVAGGGVAVVSSQKKPFLQSVSALHSCAEAGDDANATARNPRERTDRLNDMGCSVVVELG
jgi:hypothetical protein